ncbi:MULTISPECIES: Fe2+-dependent dioxygenase [Novosphingobium]|uniref:PKHD-type hydroxylase n=1 Tax=Novosphingobium mathurense TaxID=428990 RepID=A0A1U6HMP0_9SPHN|nr:MULTISPECIES: Fe2+-dependent dioxygenase [Novosphingobium]CDO38051.1 putative 2OG-Fe(II) oxygenase superfamily protein (includes the C-terminal of prolyl 4-hydroxylase alpha subunit) [Novosphingobium sp. KN65.2]SLJ97065.1 PKHD-type hydroxylase [Novosphingobium mathurense]
MLLKLEGVMSRDEVAACRALIDSGEWVDGNETSGHQSRLAKNNLQLRSGSAEERQAGEMVAAALGRTPRFVAAALPLKVFPPLFNRYGGGQEFGAHVDNAIRQVKGTEFRIRSDLSCTLFLTEPENYDGGELVIEDLYGEQRVKLRAGDMVLYPASSLHHVTPVTRGERISSFFWLQSMVRDHGEREQLYRLDCSIQTLSAERGGQDPVVLELTNLYHNLLRRWADT